MDKSPSRKNSKASPSTKIVIKTKTASPASKRTVSPASKRTASPASKRTASPASKRTASPASKRTASPASKRTASPVSKRTASPASKRNASPASKRTASPASKRTASPASKRTASPASKRTASPASKRNASPASKRTASPASKRTASPASKRTASPASKRTASPASKRSASPRSKDPSTWSKSTIIKHQEVPFKKNHNLTDLERKYCSCILKVSESGSEECLTEKEWGGVDSNGKKCYNPYAVCGIHGGSNRRCGMYYDFDKFTLEQLQAYAYARKVNIRNKNSRKLLIEDIVQYKLQEYGKL